MTPIEMFETLREKHKVFYNKVRDLHNGSPSRRQRGHGMEHNVHVALHGLDIVLHDHPNDAALAELVFMASIAHSLYRLVDRDDQAGFDHLVIVIGALANLTDNDDYLAVIQAVLDNGKKNDEGRTDNIVTVILKDADRVANVGAALAIRSGQFTPEIAPYEMAHLREANPASTYHDPTSVFEDLRGCFEWRDWMRTRRGKQIFDQKVGNLRAYLDTVAGEFEAIGMNKVVV